MKLSELLTLTEETIKTHPEFSYGVHGISVYGIDVDSAEDLTPPEWLKEVGIVLKIDDQGEIDENVLDVAISYRLSKVKVLIEIPFREDQLDEDYLLASIATNMQVALSFLPPEDESEEQFQLYLAQIRRVCQAFFKRQNLDQTIMPLTNYLQYMFINIIRPNYEFKVKDPYVIAMYANILGEECTDILKDVIREEVYAAFGGQEEFEEVATGLLLSVFDETERIVSSSRDYLRAEKEKQNSASEGESA